MSARDAVLEAVALLVRSLPTGAPWASEAFQLALALPPLGKKPDPYLLRVLKFLAERVLSVRELERPWEAPELRLFCEGFMLSQEFAEAVRRGLAQVKPKLGSAVLDLHSGPGVCLELIPSGWGKLIAVDPSPFNLEIVEERLRELGAVSYELIEADCNTLVGQLRDPIGLAVAASPVNWFYEAKSVVRRLHVVLEPGGYAVVVAPVEGEGQVSPLAPFISAVGGRLLPSREGLEDLLLGEGFARVRVREGELLTTLVAVKP